MRRRLWLIIGLAQFFILAAVVGVYAWSALPVVDDPLVRMPGTQPGQVSLEAPNRCLNCHAGYNQAVEPGFNWKGSMMTQASRDPLFWACFTVAAQDSIWAVGRPNATDICERCHFPKGWLEGRSDPTNASLMTGADFDGVQCDFCHRMWDPHYAATFDGTREGADWLSYWDETNASSTPSDAAARATFDEDRATAADITRFDGSPFYAGDAPPSAYAEAGSGQYFVSPNAAKRASFADAAARHQMFYSRFHKSKYFCATCHDVSNPILANLGDEPNALTSEANAAYSYFHVERTFSEFMLSAYGQQGGAEGIGPFAPASYDTSDPNNNIRMCQDCHMRDVVGQGANKNGVPIRPSDSVEHPNSGQPLHDLTGGNVWVSQLLASAVAGSPNYDATNAQLLGQGPAVLTLDLSQGEGIDPAAMLAGADRAMQQLALAAAIENVSYDSNSGALSFHIQNQTGHKLISGFPEGRRMFVNVKAYDASGALIYEVNPYDAAADTLKGLPGTTLSATEVHVDELVYEVHPSSELTGEHHTFHFALATDRYKDNRIPPKGFDIANAQDRLSVPVWHGTLDANYFGAAEYAGGYDDVSLTIPAGAARVEVGLYYQTTSREYVEFLRDEINGTGNTTLSSPAPSGEPAAYVIQTDPFFAQLKAWGDTIWQLWLHNRDLPGAAPILMTSATVGAPAPTCTAPTPELLSAVPGHTEVSLTWSDESADGSVAGYRVYYDQAGKAQLVADLPGAAVTSFTDAGLTDGKEYCYKVTTYYDATCESPFSNILCAIPTNQGQATQPAGVGALETGKYVTTGSGKNKTTTFETAVTFVAGEGVVLQATVFDGVSGAPVAGAVVELLITGPESLTVTSGPSDASGIAEAIWQTKAPNRKAAGTATGNYVAQVKGVTASGYHWDGVATSAGFTIQ
ncbi:MAG: fibronectin type III domain-containing protein [Anaerolineae bacterium]|nr:fibronectin type III domain-containing protein [Anaerolineae bacterium]